MIDQLEYEGFTEEEATYGADNCGADWKEQAVKKAKSYLEYSDFTRSKLIKQLEYEGFTYEEAVYGVDKVGL
ncbi:MAG: Ltp family lipoprotein [Lachnospiraceae bacterium]|nr:Ltp family lipoprotein [Lachnospiraceae bacterium]